MARDSEVVAYGQAQVLSALADEIATYLLASNTGLYEPRFHDGTLAGNAAPVRTPQDREKLRTAIQDRVRRASASLTVLEAALGTRRVTGGVER